MRITQWLVEPDNVQTVPETDEDLLEIAGDILDDACLYDALGEVLFEGEDGELYTLVYEAKIIKANEDLLSQHAYDEPE